MRLFALCAASSLALSALALTSPAQAAPFHVIKWNGTGICQIWDDGVPTKPFPADYKTMTRPVPSFEGALVNKNFLMKAGICKL